MKSYTFKKFKKQLLPYLLSFAIVLGAFSWKAPEADAIATEAVVAAIISVAIGSGLAFAVDRMTSPEVDAYWTRQAQQWLQSVGQSFSDFVDQAEQNMSARDGKLILGGSFYQSIQNFLSWWRGENGIEVGSSDVQVSYNAPTVDGYKICPIGVDVATWAKSHPDYCYPTSTSVLHIDGHVYSWNETGRIFYEDGIRKGSSLTSNAPYFVIRNTGSSAGYDNNLWIIVLNAQKSWIASIFNFHIGTAAASSLSVSQPSEEVVLEPTEALPSVALDVGASSEDDLESVIRAVFDGYRDNTLVVDQELTGAGEGEGTDTDGLFGILHGISGTLSDVLDAVLSIPATLAATVTGFIGSIGNFLSGAYFGFSGIWHYVVSWVGSMAAGAAVIWSVWNGLPAAMVIPVYATAVIVIVVGLWRRFFE